MKHTHLCLIFLSYLLTNQALAFVIYEIDGSAFSTKDSPLPMKLNTQGEKLVLIDPRQHAYGAYNAAGQLIRWGIASAGATYCADIQKKCKTTAGLFRIYSIGTYGCTSHQFPLDDGGGAAMPYCMYFNGGQAIHGASEVSFNNSSHGCVRVHLDDAAWLSQHFVEAPNAHNNFQGTRIVVNVY